ncbi:MAG: carbon-nitrogen hydrolase family protein [Caldanaerobacter subterraneus]|nr:carbon-nitrogen hydrolase family protein [Caldanaerobacter subterraneus]
MKVASVVLKKDVVYKLKSQKDWICWYEDVIGECCLQKIDIVVFPALLGEVGDFRGDFVEIMKDLSSKYRNITICPGSFFEREDDEIFHSSFLVMEGDVMLFQRQLYLSKWEKFYGLSRGTDLEMAEVKGFKVSIILPTDWFYPQVPRYAALKGVNLVLAPMAIKGNRNFARQIAGVWQNVQQNLFFAVESGFKGKFEGIEFFSESAIHAPLEMTKDDDGFLAKEGEETFIWAELDENERKKAVLKFDVLSKLNVKAYKGIFG